MSSTKIVIIVLIIIVGIFIVFVVRGSMANEPKISKQEQGKAFSKKEPPAWTVFVKSALGYLAETEELKCQKKAAPNSKLICDGLPLDEKIRIPRKKGTSFRTVDFVLKKGKARIEYEDKTDEAEDLEFDEQEFDLPSDETRNPKVGSIVILEDGGTLEIMCQTDSDCQVGQR